MMRKKRNWKNLANHPLVVTVGVLAGLATIIPAIHTFLTISQRKAVENIRQISDEMYRQSNNSKSELIYLSDFTRITELERCAAVSNGKYVIPDGGAVEKSSSAFPNLQVGIAGSRTLTKRTKHYDYYSFTKNYCLPSSQQSNREQLEVSGSLALVLNFVEAEGRGATTKGMTGVTVVSSDDSLFSICRTNASNTPPELGVESITVDREIQCPSGSTRIDD